VALRAFPNPTTSGSRIAFDVARPGRVDARVLDVTGRVVRRLASAAPYATGPASLDWDGRDASGRRLPAGVYFVEVRRGSARDVAKITVVR
jgi:flagellar hook assembly protein FlgD